MKRFIEKRYILRQNMMAVIGICLSVYFCYHLVAGQRGYLSLVSLDRQNVQISADYEGLKSTRIDIEEKVLMMRPGSIDRDLLEERVRYVLGYRYSDELVLLQNRS